MVGKLWDGDTGNDLVCSESLPYALIGIEAMQWLHREK